jgi:hypothetical protein
MLRKLFCRLEERGNEAFGFYTDTMLFKLSGAASTIFEQIEKIKPLESSFEGAKHVLGHTRLSTSTTPLINENNHPFEGDRFVIAHNGWVSSNYKRCSFDYIHDLDYNLDYNYECDMDCHMCTHFKCLQQYDYLNDHSRHDHIGRTDTLIILDELENYRYAKDLEFDSIAFVLKDLTDYADMALWIYSKASDKLYLFADGRLPLCYTYYNKAVWFSSLPIYLPKRVRKTVIFLRPNELVEFSRNGIERRKIIRGVQRRKRKGKKKGFKRLYV